MFDDIYQEILMSHNDSPYNFYEMKDCSIQHTSNNPMCGDNITVYIKINNNTIIENSFQGYGCAICVASASIMMEEIEKQSVKQAYMICESICKAYTTQEKIDIILKNMDTIENLRKIQKFPMRVKCGTLAPRGIQQAISRYL